MGMGPFHLICLLRDHEQAYRLILLQSILRLPGSPLREVDLADEYIPNMGKNEWSQDAPPAWPWSRTGGHERTYKACENFRVCVYSITEQ